MKSCFKIFLIRFYSFLSLILISLVWGCTPQGEGILGNQSSFQEEVDATTQAVPFAYDIVADTISYNSCTSFTPQGSRSSLPALKIGVHEGFVNSTGNGVVQGGLKLRTDFLNYVGRNYLPDSNVSTISGPQVQRILSRSPENQNSFLQFAIRRQSDLGINIDLIQPGISSTQSLIPVPDRDVFVLQQDLGTGPAGALLTKDLQFTLDGKVLKEGPRVYSLSTSANPIPIEAAFALNQTEDETFRVQTNVNAAQFPENILGLGEFYPDLVRKRFNSNSANEKIVITAVFGGNAADAAAGSPPVSGATTVSQIKRPRSQAGSPDLSKAYGRSYALNFTSKSSNNSVGWLRNVLNGAAVTETDLSTGEPVGSVTWTCRNFLIMQSSDYNNKKSKEPSCSPLTTDDFLVAAGAQRQKDIQLIRRHYSAKDWEVGLYIPRDANLGLTLQDRKAFRAQRELCLVPKGISCYLPTGSQFFNLPLPDGVTEIPIQYDSTKACYLTAYSQLGISYTGKTNDNDRRLLGRCAQYASFCARQSTIN